MWLCLFANSYLQMSLVDEIMEVQERHEKHQFVWEGVKLGTQLARR